eukprot:TRINITY_DN4029_c0_g1_i2.p1 TRINITY_DN4029_c0_g1~~TRINITY_DN4029_c0_g1_i2.p1  ORF type:complete len:920 (-),score=181.35 TRINITY_DN4029_c0_g1_i2:173-2932(-)
MMNTEPHQPTTNEGEPTPKKGGSLIRFDQLKGDAQSTLSRFKKNASPAILAIFQPHSSSSSLQVNTQSSSANLTPNPTPTASPTSPTFPTFPNLSPSPMPANQRPPLPSITTATSSFETSKINLFSTELSSSLPNQTIETEGPTKRVGPPLVPRRQLPTPFSSSSSATNLISARSVSSLQSRPTPQLPVPASATAPQMMAELTRQSNSCLKAVSKNICEPSAKCSLFVEVVHLTVEAIGSHSVKRTGPSSFITRIDETIQHPPELLKQQMGKVLSNCEGPLRNSLEQRLLPPFVHFQEAPSTPIPIPVPMTSSSSSNTQTGGGGTVRGTAGGGGGSWLGKKKDATSLSEFVQEAFKIKPLDSTTVTSSPSSSPLSASSPGVLFSFKDKGEKDREDNECSGTVVKKEAEVTSPSVPHSRVIGRAPDSKPAHAPPPVPFSFPVASPGPAASAFNQKANSLSCPTASAIGNGSGIYHRNRDHNSEKVLSPVPEKEDGFTEEAFEVEEESDGLVVIMGEDGRPIIKGGTVDKLIERLTYARCPNPDYVTAFLLTYRSFTTPSYLLDQLINRFNIQPPSDCSSAQLERFKKYKQRPIRLRVCNTLKWWILKHEYDFKDVELVKKLESFLTGPLISLGYEDVSQRLQNLLKKQILHARNYKLPQMVMDPINGSRLSRRGIGFASSMALFHYDPSEVAKQLTAIEFEYFQAIQPNECLNQAWNKTKKDVLAPNITNMIRRTNIVPFWVGTEIVHCNNLKSRKNLVQFFISIADKCRQLKNYNAVMEIVSGLQISPVHRLKRTWEIVSKRHMTIFRELVELMSVSNNWKNYREALNTCNPPALPYLGTYLTDLTFMEDGSPDKLDNTDLLNFVKKTKLSYIIRNIQQYQQMSYNIETIAPIRELLIDMQWVDENKMWNMSLKCEPRV